MNDYQMLSASLTGVIRAVIEDASLSMPERIALCDIVIGIFELYNLPESELMSNKFKKIKNELDARKNMERIASLN